MIWTTAALRGILPMTLLISLFPESRDGTAKPTARGEWIPSAIICAMLCSRIAGFFAPPTICKRAGKNFKEIAARLSEASIQDNSRIFNTARIEAMELENLLLVARATIVSAMARNESRGAHARDDCKERKDDEWLRHTLYFSEGDRLDYRPVQMKPLTLDSFPPKARTY